MVKELTSRVRGPRKTLRPDEIYVLVCEGKVLTPHWYRSMSLIQRKATTLPGSQVMRVCDYMRQQKLTLEAAIAGLTYLSTTEAGYPRSHERAFNAVDNKEARLEKLRADFDRSCALAIPWLRAQIGTATVTENVIVDRALTYLGQIADSLGTAEKGRAGQTHHAKTAA